jgi:hypothetical protein
VYRGYGGLNISFVYIGWRKLSSVEPASVLFTSPIQSLPPVNASQKDIVSYLTTSALVITLLGSLSVLVHFLVREIGNSCLDDFRDPLRLTELGHMASTASNYLALG